MRCRGLVLTLFLLAQVCDGCFTYAGVSLWGPRAEANRLVVAWMAIAGPAVALAGAKLLASGCGLFLYVRRVDRVLAAATVLYFAGAIVPWLLLFRTF